MFVLFVLKGLHRRRHSVSRASQRHASAPAVVLRLTGKTLSALAHDRDEIRYSKPARRRSFCEGNNDHATAASCPQVRAPGWWWRSLGKIKYPKNTGHCGGQGGHDTAIKQPPPPRLTHFRPHDAQPSSNVFPSSRLGLGTHWTESGFHIYSRPSWSGICGRWLLSRIGWHGGAEPDDVSLRIGPLVVMRFSILFILPPDSTAGWYT
jgi:hypothetical protein